MRMNTYFEAYLDDYTIVNIYRKKNTLNNKSVFYYIESKQGKQIQLDISLVQDNNDYITYQCSVTSAIEFGIEYEVFNEQGRKTPLIFAMVVKSDQFDEQFYYDGPLGMSYTKEYTQFSLWAPSAYDVKLELQLDEVKTYEMSRSSKGVYSVQIDKDLLGVKYMYLVSVNGTVYRSLDPYAKALATNATFNVVVETKDASINEKGLPIMESNCDAIIYEMSIRDFTEEKTFKSFLDAPHGMGLQYVKSLGITHIQLMPISTFGGIDENKPTDMYNWGYDVMQWQSIENSYSSDMTNSNQGILDFKEFVYICHEKGIRVNMDVVFNHVFLSDTSSLHTSVPYYYFQITKDYTYSNGTMCGNDIDSKRKMCSKLIQDSCVYWIKTFDIDGFRFDLMGILDIETMNQIVSKAKQFKKDFMIYGEGWNMLSMLEESDRATIQNNHKMPEIGFFSDVFRDTIKGKQVRNYLERGYAMGNESLLYLTMNVLSASVGDFGYQRIFNNPAQVINYVECHDNMTSWDQIDVSINKPTDIKVKHHKMMIAFVMLSQGIPFIHSGQEFARTKYHHDNTYNMGDEINHLDYTRRDHYMDIVTYFKELVRLRKQFRLLRMDTTQEVYDKIYYEPINHKALGYLLHNSHEEVYIIFNSSEEVIYKQFTKEWNVIFYNGKGDEGSVYELTLQPLDVIVLHHIL